MTCVDDFVFDCAILNNMGFACRKGRARDNLNTPDVRNTRGLL